MVDLDECALLCGDGIHRLADGLCRYLTGIRAYASEMSEQLPGIRFWLLLSVLSLCGNTGGVSFWFSAIALGGDGVHIDHQVGECLWADI